eukprot:GFUD01011142.1.p1 GENE.GFUD01011142.1~~GFUD01011142.1.p1  ORF type:complete len:329 (+),score=72.57 GFUD01011142.1:200-1186(+)
MPLYNTRCNNGQDCLFLARGCCWFLHPTPSSASQIIWDGSLINSMLPPEIFERIFQLLPPQDLKMVMLVCKRWKEVGEVPGLWSWASFCLNGERLSSWAHSISAATCSNDGAWIHVQHMAPLMVWVKTLNSRRLKTVRKLRVTMVNRRQIEAIFGSILGNGDSFLKSLSITGNHRDGFSIEPGLLGRAINKLEEFETNCELSSQQAEAIFEGINGDSCLKKLKIENCNFALVKPYVLAIAVNKLKEAELVYDCTRPGHMSKDQAEAILSQSLVTTSLKSLKFGLIIDDMYDIHDIYGGMVDNTLLLRAKQVIGEVQHTPYEKIRAERG